MRAPWLTLMFAPALTLTAQAPRERLLVSVDWLAAHRTDPDLVILHVGPEDGYGTAHIQGARWLHPRAVARPRDASPLSLELPDPAALRDSLAVRGITDRSRIVLYWGDEWVTPTARVLFTLEWAGLGDRTVVLDGGLGAWQAAGQPVTSVAPAHPTPGQLTLRPRPDLVVDADAVQARAHAAGTALLDARAPAVYDGVQEDYGKNGHVPGAHSLPWAQLYNDDTTLKPAADLRAIFRDAGVRDGDRVIVYCHIGQYATAVILAARTLGYAVQLYDGAFQDWASRNLPVETARP